MSTGSSNHHDRKIKINNIFIKKLNTGQMQLIQSTYMYNQLI